MMIRNEARNMANIHSFTFCDTSDTEIDVYMHSCHSMKLRISCRHLCPNKVPTAVRMIQQTSHS